MKKLVSRWRFAVILFPLLAGCSSWTTYTPTSTTPGTEPAGTTAGRPRVALVMKSLANEFFQTMERGAKTHQQGHAADYELIANGIKDEQDVSRQVEIVEQMIAQKVAAIVIAPADSKALVSVCKKAIDAGIVVINIDNKLDAAVMADK
ncbi:MAG TPA: substrate-binding domain-containing protein, partial [Pyrinomonadaceae bacterium]|nr:substrate-binding domain-containing protein [Pyrinomonadaceae bacterium]